MRYHHISIRMPKILKRETMPIVENVKQLDLLAVTGTITLENWPYLLKLNICRTYDPVIPHLGIYQQKWVHMVTKDIFKKVHSNIF